MHVKEAQLIPCQLMHEMKMNGFKCQVHFPWQMQLRISSPSTRLQWKNMIQKIPFKRKLHNFTEKL